MQGRTARSKVSLVAIRSSSQKSIQGLSGGSACTLTPLSVSLSHLSLSLPLPPALSSPWRLPSPCLQAPRQTLLFIFCSESNESHMRLAKHNPLPLYSLSFFSPHPPPVTASQSHFSLPPCFLPPSFPFSPHLVLFNTFQPTTTSSTGWLQWGCGHISMSRPRSAMTYYGADLLPDPESALGLQCRLDPKASGITLQNKKKKIVRTGTERHSGNLTGDQRLKGSTSTLQK